MAKRINARRKGKRAEAAVCKMLAKWWGGRFERRSMGYKNLPDIIPPATFVPLAQRISVKNRKDFHLDGLLYDRLSPLKRALVECNATGLRWMLFFKLQRRDWFIVVPRSVWQILVMACGDAVPHFTTYKDRYRILAARKFFDYFDARTIGNKW